MILCYSAAWWGACKPFKALLKKHYDEWNKEGKVVEVVIASGDQDERGFSTTFNKDYNWVAVPFNELE